MIDPTTNQMLTRITVGDGAQEFIAAPAGKVYVTNYNDGSVSVIDVATRKVLQTLTVGKNPTGLTYVPSS